MWVESMVKEVRLKLNEANYWLSNRPESYINNDTNSQNMEYIENFRGSLQEILDRFDELEVPSFRIRVISSDTIKPVFTEIRQRGGGNL